MQNNQSENLEHSPNRSSPMDMADEEYKMEGAAYVDSVVPEVDGENEDHDQNASGQGMMCETLKHVRNLDGKRSRCSDMQTGSNLDKYATKRVRSPRLDIKASQNADMKAFMSFDQKNSGDPNLNGKSRNKVHFKRKKQSSLKKHIQTPNEQIEIIVDPSIVNIQKQTTQMKKELPMLPKIKLDNIVTTTLTQKMYQTSPQTFQQTATPTIQANQQQYQFNQVLQNPPDSDAGAGLSVQMVGKYAVEDDGSSKRQKVIKKYTETIYETSEVPQRRSLPIDNYSINDIESAFMNSAIDTQFYGHTPMYLTNKNLKHIHVENKKVQACREQTDFSSELQQQTPHSMVQEMMRLHQEISSKQHDTGRRMASIRDHPSTFTSLLPNPNLCPVRIYRKEAVSTRKNKQGKVVGVHTQKVSKDMIRRARVDRYWQQVKPTLYNDDIKLRGKEETPGASPGQKSSSPSQRSKEKIQIVTSANVSPNQMNQIVEESSTFDHPMSSQYYLRSGSEEPTLPTSNQISGHVLTNERVSREMKKRHISINAMQRSKESIREEACKILGKLDKIDIKFRHTFNCKPQFKDGKKQNGFLGSPTTHIQTSHLNQPSQLERTSSESSSSSKCAHFPVIKKQVHEFLPDENINYSQLERNKQLIRTGLVKRGSNERRSGSGRKRQDNSLSPDDSKLSKEQSVHRITANGFGAQTMIHSTLEPACSSKKIQTKSKEQPQKLSPRMNRSKKYASRDRQVIYKRSPAGISNIVGDFFNKDQWSVNSRMPERFHVKKIPPNHNIQQLILTQSELLQRNRTILGPLGIQSPSPLHAHRTLLQPTSPSPLISNPIRIKSLQESEKQTRKPSGNQSVKQSPRPSHHVPTVNTVSIGTQHSIKLKRNTLGTLNMDQNKIYEEMPSSSTMSNKFNKRLKNAKHKDQMDGLRQNVDQIEPNDKKNQMSGSQYGFIQTPEDEQMQENLHLGLYLGSRTQELDLTLKITKPVELHDRGLPQREGQSPRNGSQNTKQLVLKTPAAIEISNELYSDNIMETELKPRNNTSESKKKMSERQALDKSSTLNMMQIAQIQQQAPFQNSRVNSPASKNDKNAEKGTAEMHLELGPKEILEMEEHSDSPQQVDLKERFSPQKSNGDAADDSKCLLDRVVNRISQMEFADDDKNQEKNNASTMRQVKVNSPGMSRNQDKLDAGPAEATGRTLKKSPQSRYQLVISETDKTHYIGSGLHQNSENIEYVMKSPQDSMKHLQATSIMNSPQTAKRPASNLHLTEETRDLNKQQQSEGQSPMKVDKEQQDSRSKISTHKTGESLVKDRYVSTFVNVQSLMDYDFQEQECEEDDSDFSSLIHLQQMDLMPSYKVPSSRRLEPMNQAKLKQAIQQRRQSDVRQRQLREASINQALVSTKFVVLPQMDLATAAALKQPNIRVPSPAKQNGNFVPLQPLSVQKMSPGSRSKLPTTSASKLKSSPSFGPPRKGLIQGPWNLWRNGPSRKVLEAYKVFQAGTKGVRKSPTSIEQALNVVQAKDVTQAPQNQASPQPSAAKQPSNEKSKVPIKAPKLLYDADQGIYKKPFNDSLPINEFSHNLSDDNIYKGQQISIASQKSSRSQDKIVHISNEDIRIVLKDKKPQQNDPGPETVKVKIERSSELDATRKGTDFVFIANRRGNLHDFNRETSMSHQVQSDSPTSRTMKFEVKNLTGSQSKHKNSSGQRQLNEASGGKMPIHLNIDDIIEANTVQQDTRKQSATRVGGCPSATNETVTNHIGSPAPSNRALKELKRTSLLKNRIDAGQVSQSLFNRIHPCVT